MSRPWMKFYPSDWRADPLLRSCDPLARYLWLEMVGLMHEAKPYGHLTLNGKPMDDLTLARLAGMPLKAVRAALKQLGDKGVYSVTDDGVIVSRRMVRDEKNATSRRVNGAKGGNPALKNQALSRCPDNHELIHEDKPQTPDARGTVPDGTGAGAPSRAIDEDADLFRRGREILGPKAGGVIAALKKACGGVSQCRSVIEAAATKDRPMEYVQGVLRKRVADGSDVVKKLGTPSRADGKSDDFWRPFVQDYVRNRGVGWPFHDISPPPDDPNTKVPDRVLNEFGISRAAA